MATIITRLYKDAATADAVVADLKADDYADRNITVISGSDNLAQRMDAASVPEDAASAFAARIGEGNVLVVVKALLGQAERAVNIVNRQPTVDSGLEKQDIYVPTTYKKDMSKLIMKDHPLMLTTRDQVSGEHARRYADFLVPLLSKQRDRAISVYRGTKRFGDFLVPLLSKQRDREISVYRGTKRFGDFLVPLLSKQGDRDLSVLRGTVRYADFLAPLIIRK